MPSSCAHFKSVSLSSAWMFFSLHLICSIQLSTCTIFKCLPEVEGILLQSSFSLFSLKVSPCMQNCRFCWSRLRMCEDSHSLMPSSILMSLVLRHCSKLAMQQAHVLGSSWYLNTVHSNRSTSSLSQRFSTRYVTDTWQVRLIKVERQDGRKIFEHMGVATVEVQPHLVRQGQVFRLRNYHEVNSNDYISSSPSLNFHPDRESGFIDVGITRLRVVAVCGFPDFFMQQLKALMERICLDLLPAKFDGHFAEHVLEVVEQGSEVDPDACLLEGRFDGVDVLQHVVGSVNEETSDHTIEACYSILIDLCELTCSHGEVGVLGHDLQRQLIRHSHRSEHLLLTLVVYEPVDKWEDLVLLFVIYAVENEVRAIQHEVSHLVALGIETCLDQLQGQPAQPTAWHQHSVFPMQVFFGHLHQHNVIFNFRTFGAPFSKKLFHSCSYFGQVVAQSYLFWLEVALAISQFNNEVQELLIGGYCFFHLLSFPFPDQFEVCPNFVIAEYFVE